MDAHSKVAVAGEPRFWKLSASLVVRPKWQLLGGVHSFTSYLLFNFGVARIVLFVAEVLSEQKKS